MRWSGLGGAAPGGQRTAGVAREGRGLADRPASPGPVGPKWGDWVRGWPPLALAGVPSTPAMHATGGKGAPGLPSDACGLGSRLKESVRLLYNAWGGTSGDTEGAH